MWTRRLAVLLTFTLTLTLGGHALAQEGFVEGGGNARKDCRTALSLSGDLVISGNEIACGDGGTCDTDGTANGVCQVAVRVCVNVPDETGRCPAANVKSVKVKGKGSNAGLKAAASSLQSAAAAIPLPSRTFGCSAPVNVPVDLKQGTGKRANKAVAKLSLKAKSGDNDNFRITCVARGTSPTTTTTSTPSSTTSTTLGSGSPQAGLQTEIIGVTVSAQGTVVVNFRLTDDAGRPVIPVPGSTEDPDEARVRLTIARLDVDTSSQEGNTQTFTRYRSYVLNQAGQPTYDTGGMFAEGSEPGTWTYTFGTTLPASFNAALTHTVGGQVERLYQGDRLTANPLIDFVPNGSAVTTTRDVATTSQCNDCHAPLEAHGGARREVRLCQLCHTDQATDPDTGSALELSVMVHRIHRGNNLPSIDAGPVGTKYAFIGFGSQEHVYAEKVKACVGAASPNAFDGVPCETDADCGPAGTCSGDTVIGVGYPKDIRTCDTCHASGANASNWYEKPSAHACTACHDTTNPSTETTAAGPPGTNHIDGAPGMFADAQCNLCHTPMGPEFDINVQGAHTVPLRASVLQPIAGTILAATGTPGNPIVVDFQLSLGGTPITTLAELGAMGFNFNRIAFNASGPTDAPITEYGENRANPFLQGTAFGSGSNGTLTPPAGGSTTWRYTFPATITSPVTDVGAISNVIPAGAMRTWAVGMEARRPVTLTVPEPDITVNEAMPNDVFYFSVDGSAVEERRVVVADARCEKCHDTFSIDFSIHGNLRNKQEYCVICHDPGMTDAGVREDVFASGAATAAASINHKVMIHKIHRGEDLTKQPYIVYGRNSTPTPLGEVRFPGNEARCETCHEPETYLLPLPSGLLPTRTQIIAGVGSVSDGPDVLPVTSACLACHDTDAAAAHAATNTAGTLEACDVCHGEGRVAAVSEAHATAVTEE